MKLRLIAAAMTLPFAIIATNAQAWAQDAAAPASEPAKADAAAADDEESSGPWEIDGEIGLHSDYRFRGISLSGKDPEATAELSISHESGFYVSAWASNVDLGTGKANDLEVDLTGGFSHDLGPINFDLNAVYYTYPGNSDFNYWEFNASLGKSIGEGEVRVGFAYAPSQTNIGDLSNRYYYVSADFPIKGTPMSVHGNFGIEDGAFADHKKDWLIGASYDMGSGFTGTVDYVDTAHSFTTAGSPTVVVSIAKSF